MVKFSKIFFVSIGLIALAGCSTLPQPRGAIKPINPEEYYQDEPNKGHKIKVPANETEKFIFTRDGE